MGTTARRAFVDTQRNVFSVNSFVLPSLLSVLDRQEVSINSITTATTHKGIPIARKNSLGTCSAVEENLTGWAKTAFIAKGWNWRRRGDVWGRRSTSGNRMRARREGRHKLVDKHIYKVRQILDKHSRCEIAKYGGQRYNKE